MNNEIVNRVGAVVCRALDTTGFVPDACNNSDGRGMVGLVSLSVLLLSLIVIAWRRFL